MEDWTVQDLASRRDSGEDFVLLDVRTHQELAVARLDPCVHIPLHELAGSLALLEPHRNQTIVCMCHHGVRSAMAQGLLHQAGFQSVRNLTGGIHAYAEEIDPTIPRYG